MSRKRPVRENFTWTLVRGFSLREEGNPRERGERERERERSGRVEASNNTPDSRLPSSRYSLGKRSTRADLPQANTCACAECCFFVPLKKDTSCLLVLSLSLVLSHFSTLFRTFDTILHSSRLFYLISLYIYIYILP